MSDVTEVKSIGEDYELNTGSPHYVMFENKIEEIDIIPIAQKILYSDRYPQGINVNFVEKTTENSFKIRTYERGVEDETYSCGTGVTAASIVCGLSNGITDFCIETKGGRLGVKFDKIENGFENIFLSGPAVKAFEGEIKFINDGYI
jgi:diaminopimelate epimerase